MVDVDWELLWAPYDQMTYQLVLSAIQPDDVVIDIGAGDLRLSTQIAGIARRVEAVEIQPALVEGIDKINLPENLHVYIGDALLQAFPSDITCSVLLMRHCSQYFTYLTRLRQTNCRRLITNARWRMGVEIVHLDVSPVRYNDLRIGWYACECGSVGFKTGDVNLITPEIDQITSEVVGCPVCC